MKFHNGDAFTGDDVVATWKIIMNPDFGAFNQNGWDKITDIKVDGNQVVITTSEVYAPFMSYVGVGNGIASKSAIDKGIDSFKQEFGRAPYRHRAVQVRRVESERADRRREERRLLG